MQEKTLTSLTSCDVTHIAASLLTYDNSRYKGHA